ncbi:IclR family transcriptional regulator [Propionibacterium sp. NM47_B9-13]|nr:IclR family transcriptional regulator [Propionibacterium sp. NM47_B9-13]
MCKRTHRLCYYLFMQNSEASSTAPAPIAAIDRALSVLTTLAESGPDGISLTELSQALASNKSTIYRVLHTMKLRGFAVQHSNNGNYSLGAAALSLHHHFPQDAMLRRDLQPVLAALSGSAHELIHLGTLSGDRVRYLDKIEPDRAIAVRSRIGLTTYAYTTALGRSILAGRAIEPASLGAYLPDFVEHRRSALDHFTREVERAKHVGWSREIEENEPDVACIGIPITLPDGDIVALSITAPAARMTPEHMAKVSATAFRTVDQYLPDGYTRVIPT